MRSCPAPAAGRQLPGAAVNCFASSRAADYLLNQIAISALAPPRSRNLLARRRLSGELYGIAPYGNTHYPSSSSVYDMRTVAGPEQAPIDWQLSWSDMEWATCPGHPNGTFTEIHNATQQDVGW